MGLFFLAFLAVSCTEQESMDSTAILLAAAFLAVWGISSYTGLIKNLPENVFVSATARRLQSSIKYANTSACFLAVGTVFALKKRRALPNTRRKTVLWTFFDSCFSVVSHVFQNRFGSYGSWRHLAHLSGKRLSMRLSCSKCGGFSLGLSVAVCLPTKQNRHSTCSHSRLCSRHVFLTQALSKSGKISLFPLVRLSELCHSSRSPAHPYQTASSLNHVRAIDILS